MIYLIYEILRGLLWNRLCQRWQSFLFRARDVFATLAIATWKRIFHSKRKFWRVFIAVPWYFQRPEAGRETCSQHGKELAKCHPWTRQKLTANWGAAFQSSDIRARMMRDQWMVGNQLLNCGMRFVAWSVPMTTSCAFHSSDDCPQLVRLCFMETQTSNVCLARFMI